MKSVAANDNGNPRFVFKLFPGERTRNKPHVKPQIQKVDPVAEQRLEDYRKNFNSRLDAALASNNRSRNNPIFDAMGNATPW